MSGSGAVLPAAEMLGGQAQDTWALAATAITAACLACICTMLWTSGWLRPAKTVNTLQQTGVTAVNTKMIKTDPYSTEPRQGYLNCCMSVASFPE